MNVRSRRRIRTFDADVTLFRSRYQPSDPPGGGDSRRSPRERSPIPARYSDRRDSMQYNNTARDGDRQDRSSSGSRLNNSAFLSDRERYREQSRELPREFPNRDPPRGPKALTDNIPSGPRATAFSNEFRSRGRARGRGYRDDSRDRGRESEREFRDRWDDRAAPAFRDDRGRGRDWEDGERGDRSRRESVRGRRPSPPVRGRSPSRYEPRENWDRRDSRDAQTEIDPSARGGYTRGRGRGRGDWEMRGGRGRVGVYRTSSRSPERDRREGDGLYAPRPGVNRSPPPQAPEVPAFGSVPTGPRAERPVTEREPAIEGPVGRPVLSVSNAQVPTAPKSFAAHVTPPSRHHPTSHKWVKAPSPDTTSSAKIAYSDAAGDLTRTSLATTTILKTSNLDTAATPATASPESVQEVAAANVELPLAMSGVSPDSTPQVTSATVRIPIALVTIEDEQPSLQVIEEVLQNSVPHDESDDEIDDDYFEKEAKGIRDRLAEVSLSYRDLFLTSSIYCSTEPELTSPEELISQAEQIFHKDSPRAPKVQPLPAPRLIMAVPEDDESDSEYLKTLPIMRARMQTPPVSSLPFSPDKLSWLEDLEWQQSLAPPPGLAEFIMKDSTARDAQRQAEIKNQQDTYKQNYKEWIEFHRSDDPLAVSNRERWATALAKEVEDEVSRAASVVPAADGRPEGRRAASRFQTEHDIAMVMKASEKEAKEQTERSNRAASSKAASEKEAVIPDMFSKEDRELDRVPDFSKLIDPDRVVAIMELPGPVDNFTEEEAAIFLKTMLEYPKQWGRIAAAVSGRSVKNCIQYYYLNKWKLGLKDQIRQAENKAKGRKRGGGGRGAKPKASAIMASLAARENEADDATDAGEGTTERRGRPRRAAAPTFTFNNEAGPSESDTATPAPSGKRASKGDAASEGGAATGRRKAKSTVVREKASKAKNGQLLAAAPQVQTPKPRDEFRDGNPISTKDMQSSQAPSSHPLQMQWDAGPQLHHPYSGSVVFQDRPTVMEKTWLPGSYGDEQKQLPTSFDPQHQDRRNASLTSSYWSVPEQTDFPALLQHFGTDWAAIAKYMGSKTHIMVYTTVFQKWLSVAQDSNKSRRVANIEKQVKNYYQRQVDQGRADYEDIARIADEKKSRGENTGPAPTPTLPIKRRYDGVGGSHGALPSEGGEDMYASEQAALPLQHLSPRPNPGSRFPPLVQGVNMSQAPMHAAPSVSNVVKQTPQQLAPQTQQNRQPRGPALGYFNSDRERPAIQPVTTYGQPSLAISDPVRSQRTQMVAQEAQLEKQQALRIEEQQLQARQQQHRLKQESELQNLNQLEPYSSQPQQHNILAQSRNEPVSPIRNDSIRRTSHLSQYRNISDIGNAAPPASASQIPVVNRSVMSGPPVHQERSTATPAQPPVAAPPRQGKTSSIMSLLNDEPSEPRPSATARATEMLNSQINQSQSPAPQHSLYMQHPRPVEHQPAHAQAHVAAHAPIHVPSHVPAHVRRESSTTDIRGVSNQYQPNQQARTPTAPQPPIRLNESPYSAPAPGQPQSQIRPQAGSPTTSASVTEREFYAHQQYIMQHQQSSASPAQHNMSYQAPPSQQVGSRPLAFGTSSHHPASPMTAYSTHGSLHGARRGSIDGRQGAGLSTSQGPTGPSYAPTQSQGQPISTQYPTQFQHPLQPSRFSSHQIHSTTQPQPRLSQQLPPQRQRTPPLQGYGQGSHLGVPPRAYTPTTYDSRGYTAPTQQQQQQQHQQQHQQQQQQQQQSSMERLQQQDPETAAIHRSILQHQRDSYGYDRRADEAYQRDLERQHEESRRRQG